jgi:NAD+ synthase
VTTHWQRDGRRLALRTGPRSPRSSPGRGRSDYTACVLGLRDYVDKNGFPGVVLGLSGGIDSALVAAMAVDALGRSGCAA